VPSQLALAGTVWFGAHAMMVGGVVSTTVTVKLHEAVLVLMSVTVQLTVVVPEAKALPEAGTRSRAGSCRTRQWRSW
jgi:hypothetical protein